MALRIARPRVWLCLDLGTLPEDPCALSEPAGLSDTSGGWVRKALLRAIAGLIRPEAGAIRFDGAEPEAARAEHLHLLGHHDGLKPHRLARDEFAFQCAWAGGASPDAAIERLILAPLLDLEVRRLSAGQRRRLALARLIAAPRPLWLLDEPMAPLDAVWRARFGEIMAEHLAGGGLILAAIHDPLPIPARPLELAG